MAEARGAVRHVTYYSPESGYTVATLDLDRSEGLPPALRREVTVVGRMPSLNVGEYVTVQGHVDRHREYGDRLQVTDCRVELPVTEEGILRFLSSGFIKGVGPATAKRLVDAWGAETLNILDRDLDRLEEVPRLHANAASRIRKGWEAQKSKRALTLLLQEFGVTPAMAQRIHDELGTSAVFKLRENPFLLCEISNVGFKTADSFAARLGVQGDLHVRLEAALLYVMQSALNEGHTHLIGQELIAKASELTEAAPERVAEVVRQTVGAGKLTATRGPGGEPYEPEWRITKAFAPATPQDGRSGASDPDTASPASREAVPAKGIEQEIEPLAVYLNWMAQCEQGLTGNLSRLMKRQSLFEDLVEDFDWNEFWREQGEEFLLTEGQKEAVQAAFLSPFAVLTGGPGTGKTTTIRSIISICERKDLQVQLAAPTGRAAKRMQESTDHAASTLHRLLDVRMWKGVMTFERNEANPLEGDLLIVDEASMLDVRLAHHLCKAIPDSMHVMLVGDVDQLPSVSPGNVLADIIRHIEAGEAGIPWEKDLPRVVRLTEIHRQGRDSAVVMNAHRIRAGEMPVIDNASGKDFYFMPADDPLQAQQLCVDLISRRLPDYYGFEPREIMLLSPLRKGAAGVEELNRALQARLNPPSPDDPELTLGGQKLRARDPVMQLRNDYEKLVFNGDMGTLVQVKPGGESIVNCDDRILTYTPAELHQLTLAYAVTIHKSQGSEYPAVVVPLMMAHWIMLQRNLLYTALTRAKRLAVIVGQQDAIRRAVENATGSQRNSALYESLQAAT